MSDTGEKEIPREWGPYIIDEVVSSAGPTITYRARRATGGPRYERQVLLKTLRPHAAATREQLQVLEREADACARLRSPLFATLLDTTRNGDEYALIFADEGGFRLTRLIGDNGHLQTIHLLAIGIEICRALGHLHRHGYRHGNVRPEVIEIGLDGALRLHDGFADSNAHAVDELTSPALLSPEQILGRDGDIRSDVFLFGSLLYLLATGRPAFGMAHGGVGQRVRHDSPAPPHELVRQFDRNVSKTIMRCLAKRPSERFADMGSLACEFELMLRQETALPVDHLLVDALAEANLADPWPLPKDRELRRGIGRKKSHFGAWVAGFSVLAAIVLIAILIQRSPQTPPASVSGIPRGVWRQPARLRVIAHPWAEIHVDGEHIATTPLAFPIDLRPGHHTVVFKHPFAPPEARDLQIIAGQTIALDVQMKVKRPAPNKGPQAGTKVQDEGP